MGPEGDTLTLGDLRHMQQVLGEGSGLETEGLRSEAGESRNTFRFLEGISSAAGPLLSSYRSTWSVAQ